MKNIAVLIGSPRRRGNTEALAAAFIRGAESAGHHVDVLRAASMKIHGCIACNACYRDAAHRCVFDDDMTDCYGRLAGADVIVAATPIYFYGVSSQLKSLIDRLHNPIRGGFRVRKLVLLAVCADDDGAVFDSVRAMYRATLAYFRLENGGEVCVRGVPGAGDIAGSPLLAEAERLGRDA